MASVWSALEAGGYEPHGEAWAFRSRCPGHAGGNPDSLAVSPGADGRALLHCFVGCDVEAITAAIGLGVPDLFAAGHRRARRLDVRPARRADFTGPARDIADMVYAIDQLDETWRAELSMQCPSCGSGSAMFVVSTRHSPFVSCPGNCTVEQVAQTLAGALADRMAA
jgi:hypothetical protein